MRDINKVILIGRLTRDLELRNTKNGKKYCFISLASNFDDTVSYFDIKAYDTLAEKCTEMIGKGKQICAVGRLHSYKDENNITKTQIIADTIQFLSAKEIAKNSDNPANDNNYQEEEPF